MLIEYTDVAQRKRALARLLGIERRVWVPAVRDSLAGDMA
jgi:hypothetical protein